MASSTAVQFVFGVLARWLLEDFAISRAQLGLLTTAAFVVGGVGSVPGGRLVDRIGGRRVQIASLTLICVSSLIMAASPTYPLLLLGAALTGGALATCNPTTNKLIASHMDPGDRGVVMGLKQAGVQAGAFLIGISIPAAATAWGWRIALAATVVVPAATIAASLLLIPPDARSELRVSGQAEARQALQPSVWWLASYALLMGAGVAPVSGYVPLYAEEALGLSVGAAGLVAGVIGLVGILSRIAWGWGAERLGQFSKPLTWLSVGAVASVLLLLSARALGPPALWAGALTFGATAITWNAIGMLAVLAEVSPQDAGRASGLVLTGFYVGFVVSPMLFGYSVDRTGSYDLGWGAVALVFVLAAAVAAGWHRSRGLRSPKNRSS
jgi:predicted MFS family arabinose efflux permease